MNTNWLDYTLLTLVIIGAINWGLIGFFRFDLIASLFLAMSWFSPDHRNPPGLSGLYPKSRLFISSALSIRHKKSLPPKRESTVSLQHLPATTFYIYKE